MLPTLYCLLAGVTGIVAAEGLDIGDVNQFNGRLQNAPTLSGDTIWLTGKEGDGFDIALSPDVQDNLHGVLEGCGDEIDNTCYQELNHVLDLTNIETDENIDRGAFWNYWQETVKGGVGVVFEFIKDVLLVSWKTGKQQGKEIGLYLPEAKAQEVAKVVTATEIVLSVDGSAMLTGTQAPAVTAVSTASGAYSAGDLMISVEGDLAARIDEVMKNNKDCEDGRKFDREHPTKRARAPDNTNLGKVICVAEAMIGMIRAGGGFNDLLFLGTDQMTYAIAEGQRNLLEAYGVVHDFATNIGPTIGLPNESLEQATQDVFLMIYEKLKENTPVGEENRIPESLIESKAESGSQSITMTTTKATRTTTSATSSSSTSSCPDPTKSPLWCGYEKNSNCSMTFPSDRKDVAICQDGEFKDCDCNAPAFGFDNVVSIEEQQFIIDTSRAFEEIKEQAHLTFCDNDFSIVTTDYLALFYTKFCDEDLLDLRSELKKTYKNRDMGSQRQEKYDGLQFTLEWSGGENCRTTCKDAFYGLTKGYCGEKGAEAANQKFLELTQAGAVDIGCGMYAYKIDDVPARDPRITCRNHPLMAPVNDGDGQSGVESAINKWCADNDGKTVDKSPGTDNIYWRWGISEFQVPDRSSYWLRATLNGCSDKEQIVEKECVKALTDGLNQCDPGSAWTHGLTASVDCLDYSIDLSGVTRDDSPPWDEHAAFPAPEFAPGKNTGGAANAVSCSGEKYRYRPLSNDDLEAAIDHFCQDKVDINGFGNTWQNMYAYPPKGSQQFYPNADLTMHLELGAETINNGAPEPYDNMDWCKDYDWKMVRDDCTFALRKMFDQCAKPEGFEGEEYTYRCVHYKVFPVNINPRG